MYNSTYPWYNYSVFIFFLLYLKFHGLEPDLFFFLPFAYELCSKALLPLPSSQFSGDPDWKEAGMWRGQCLWDRVGGPFWEGQGFLIQLMMHLGEGHLLTKEGTLLWAMRQENQRELPRAEVTKSVTKLSRGKEAVHNLADEMAQKERSGFRRSSPRRMWSQNQWAAVSAGWHML